MVAKTKKGHWLDSISKYNDVIQFVDTLIRAGTNVYGVWQQNKQENDRARNDLRHAYENIDFQREEMRRMASEFILIDISY